jgi:hypothetical protein
MRGAAAALVLVAACGATVDPPGDDPDGGSGPGEDAPTIGDAAPPPDAAPCTGGNAQAITMDTCYEAFLSLPLAWNAAQAVCAGRGGGLATIETEGETEMLAALVGPTRIFIGGNDTANESLFVWTNGAAVDAGFTAWRDGEPNDGSGVFAEDCMVLEGQNGGTWDDRPCDTDPLAGVPGQYFYVCERPL